MDSEQQLAARLEAHGDAAGTLRRILLPLDPVPWEGEVEGNYAFTADISPTWLRDTYAELAKALTPVGYVVAIQIAVDDWSATFRASDGGDTVTGQLDDSYPSPPRGLDGSAWQHFETLGAMAGQQHVPLDQLLDAVLGLDAAAAGRVGLRLHVHLDKAAVAAEFARSSAASSQVGFWIFPEAVTETIETRPLDNFEGWFAPGRRFTLLVAGAQGRLEGDVLSIFGARPLAGDAADHHDSLAAGLIDPSPPATVTRIARALKFRNEQCVWLPQTPDVAPECLRVRRSDAGGRDMTALADAIEQRQALLALAFLANRCTFEDAKSAEQTLTFSSTLQTKVGPAEAAAASPADRASVATLYDYAFDGSSVDKLEIVRQTMALVADSPQALFTKATNVRHASERSYAIHLRGSVAEFFAARQAVQDHVHQVVSATEQAATGLSRDSAERLFKIAGIVATAVVAAALKPDLSAFAGLFAAASIVLYLTLTIRYFAGPLDDSAAAQKEQAERHIRTFDDILGESYTRELIADKRLQRAWRRYSEERAFAGRVLVWLWAIALVVAWGFLLGWLLN